VVNRGLIDAVDFLRPLGAGAKDDLAARAVTRRFAAGQRLWTAGTAPRGLFVVLSGRVRIVRSAGGRQHVVHTEGAGATLGEVPLFAGGMYPATAVASEPVECLVLDHAALATAIRAHPELAWALLARLAGRIRLLVERLSAQTGDSVRARLSAYLLGRPADRGGLRSLGGTQQQVAEEIGTGREVVVRLLRALAREAVIDYRGRGRYVVRDEEALRRLAGAL
jgi:CRP-like cAMP-binding protein